MSDLDDLTTADTLEQQRPPSPDYEDITIRELSIGFAGGAQDMILYPEDEMVEDGQGNIRVTFGTMGDAEFVAYAGHTQWHSLKEIPHRRVKGTLRPDPRAMMRQQMEEVKRRREQLVAEAERRLASDVDD